jgi:hypothetical protein
MDDIFLGRQSLLQEAASSTLKVRRRKNMRRKEKTKASFEGERKCYGLDQYSSQPLLYLLFRFVFT